jgi:sn-glycerol 3-phosphate transport system ATP-binding protein
MAAVSIRHLGVDKPATTGRSAAPIRILDDICLEVEDGELLVLIGPSGCGKSTLLRCIAGLEAPSRGELALDDRVVNNVPPRDRDIAMVFQSYALYPHMTVFDNLAFALRMRHTAAAEVTRRVEETAQMLEIGHLMQRLPRELSGGQRQRVAMGRAVVRRPRLFLFDEPLSNLDAALRQQMRLELLRLHRRLSTTTVYVTHDQVEAMTLAHRIAVLKQGALIQLGRPSELYDRPHNTFVARFFGTPEMNLVAGQLAEGSFVADEGDGQFRLAAADYPSGPATFGIRAEHVQLVDAAHPGALPAVVDVVENLGSDALVHLRVGRQAVVARCAVEEAPAAQSQIGLVLAAARWHLFARPPASEHRDGLRLAPGS